MRTSRPVLLNPRRKRVPGAGGLGCTALSEGQHFVKNVIVGTVRKVPVTNVPQRARRQTKCGSELGLPIVAVEDPATDLTEKVGRGVRQVCAAVGSADRSLCGLRIPGLRSLRCRRPSDAHRFTPISVPSV
jgi:hypothetical protein